MTNKGKILIGAACGCPFGLVGILIGGVLTAVVVKIADKIIK